MPSLMGVLGEVFKPAIDGVEQWGKLADEPDGDKIRKNFLDNYGNFLHFMKGNL